MKGVCAVLAVVAIAAIANEFLTMTALLVGAGCFIFKIMEGY